MLKVGLTGNMGSGKSTVSRLFELLCVPVYNADRESKKFLEAIAVRKQVAGLFGNAILDSGQNIDRKLLAGIVFSDPKALQSLNNILHPLVKRDFILWSRMFSERAYIVHEAAIIFESGFQDEFDFIIHVSCPNEIAVERVIIRDGLSREKILDRMQFQMEDEKKTTLSDFVIRNDGSEMLIPQVLAIHQQLSEVGA